MPDDPQEVSATSQILHASCVALNECAVLVLGASGRGKSALALQLMAFGCTLVSDDRTEVRASSRGLLARAPGAIEGLIEARGVGILRAPSCQDVLLAFAVDLDKHEGERLPSLHTLEILGRTLICLHDPRTASFPAALLQMLKDGRAEPR
jgi:HPr kinase/phosphorylase